MMRLTLPPTLALLLAVACGGQSNVGPPSMSGPKTIKLADGTIVLDPPPPEGGQQLTSDPFTVPAGKEKYFCWTYRSPDAERGIIKVDPIAGAVEHHVVIFQTIVDEPDGFFECPILVKTSWRPIWAGGAGAKGLMLPDGVAFMVPPKTQYLVQYHLLNATRSDITTRAAMNLTYATDLTRYQPAGLFALGKFNFTIPPNKLDHQIVSECRSGKDMHVFAAFPHMHQLGKRLTFEAGADAARAEMKYQINPWVFGNQPMDPVDFQINRGQFLRATCHWDNPGGHEIGYGESTNDEMCFFVLFYYPFTGLDGCF